MDILFLAPSYNNLYMPILKAMKDAGHNVTYVEDVQFSRSPYYPVSGYKDKIKKLLKLLYFKLCKVEENYWKTKINAIPELSKKYGIDGETANKVGNRLARCGAEVWQAGFRCSHRCSQSNDC